MKAYFFKIFSILVFFPFFTFGQKSIIFLEKARTDTSQNAEYYYILADSAAKVEKNYRQLVKIDIFWAQYYMNKGYFDKAVLILNKSLQFLEKNNQKKFQTELISKLGDLYYETGDAETALMYYNKAMFNARKFKLLEIQRNLALKIAYIYKDSNEEKFFSYYSYAEAIADSMLQIRLKNTEENADSLFLTKLDEIRLKTITDSLEKTRRRNLILQRQQQRKELELLRKKEALQYQKQLAKTRLVFLIIFAILTFFLIGFIVWIMFLLKFKKKAYLELQNLYKELEEKNKIIEKTNEKLIQTTKKIKENINYAKQLQEALLPSKYTMTRLLKDVLIFNQPRDIIGGDFFWYGETEDYIFVMGADCTGHGISGSFLAILSSLTLNHIIMNEKIYSPAQIIRTADNLLIETLHHDENNPGVPNDGMDLSILRIDKNKNQITISAANQIVVGFIDGKKHIIEGDIFSIGAYLNKNFSPIIKEHTLTLGTDNTFYLFSDGFPDQFNTKRKKYLTKNFIAFLEKIKSYDFEKQLYLIKTELVTWKGTMKQMDDIMILGVKI